jgi:hypothetical protein
MLNQTNIELFNQWGPLNPDFPLEKRIQDLVKTHGHFCRQMRDLFYCATTSEAEKWGLRQSILETTLRNAVLSEGESSRYKLRKGSRIWTVICDGKEGTIADGKAMNLVAYLLKNPPEEPIHASRLEALVRERDSKSPEGLLVETSGKHGFQKEAVVERTAQIQELSINSFDEKYLDDLRERKAELLAAIEDVNLPQSERDNSQTEYDQLKKSLNSKFPPSQAQKAVDRVRQLLKRLVDQLLEANSKPGEPDETLRAFGDHINKYIVRTSSSHANTGLPGCFTYEPPPGVEWAD